MEGDGQLANVMCPVGISFLAILLGWILTSSFSLSVSVFRQSASEDPVRGTLKRKVNRSTVNPKWRVIFENQDIQSQDLFESSFGPIVPLKHATPELEREVVTPENQQSPPKSTHTASPKETKKRKTVSFEESGSNNKAGAAAASKQPSKLSREERSKRRRAMQEENERRMASKKLPKDVVQIPMLTGTLLLYKGTKRRAEFVRHV